MTKAVEIRQFVTADAKDDPYTLADVTPATLRADFKKVKVRTCGPG